MIHVKPSATVTNACTACGGSPTGFVRYPTTHRHATYCPYISEVNADRWARWQDSPTGRDAYGRYTGAGA